MLGAEPLRVETLRAYVQEFSSALDIDYTLDVRLEDRLELAAYRIVASFKALVEDDPHAPELADVYESWWDHFKGERLRSAVALNLISPPKLRRVKQRVRMCPHLGAGRDRHVDFLFHREVPKWIG